MALRAHKEAQGLFYTTPHFIVQVNEFEFSEQLESEDPEDTWDGKWADQKRAVIVGRYEKKQNHISLKWKRINHSQQLIE